MKLERSGPVWGLKQTYSHEILIAFLIKWKPRNCKFVFF